MIEKITPEQLEAFVRSVLSSAPLVRDYLNKLNPRRVQTGCVVRLARLPQRGTFIPSAHRPCDSLVLPAGSLTWDEWHNYVGYSREKMQRMVYNDHNSSAIDRNPSEEQFAGAIRLDDPLLGLAVSGWWEEYDVLHAVWLGLTNELITGQQAMGYLREIDSPKFGSGEEAYRHLNPRLNTEMPPPGFVKRYFANSDNQNPPVWNGEE